MIQCYSTAEKVTVNFYWINGITSINRTKDLLGSPGSRYGHSTNALDESPKPNHYFAFAEPMQIKPRRFNFLKKNYNRKVII